jgi:hypothetical protein
MNSDAELTQRKRMMKKIKLRRVSKPKRIVLVVILCLAAAYFLAMIPSSPPDILTQADNPPFEWNQSNYWKSLELAFNHARKLGCPALRSTIRVESAAVHAVLEQIETDKPGVGDPIWYSLEKTIYRPLLPIRCCHIKQPREP